MAAPTPGFKLPGPRVFAYGRASVHMGDADR